MRRWYDRIQSFIVRLVALSLVLLVVAQGLMHYDQSLRFYMSWAERLNGTELTVYTAAGPGQEDVTEGEYPPGEGCFVLALGDHESLPRAVVAVNGQRRGAFNERTLVIEVAAGDVVSVDTGFYDYQVDFIVESHSSGLAWPQTGQRFSSENGLAVIGEIMVK